MAPYFLQCDAHLRPQAGQRPLLEHFRCLVAAAQLGGDLAAGQPGQTQLDGTALVIGQQGEGGGKGASLRRGQGIGFWSRRGIDGDGQIEVCDAPGAVPEFVGDDVVGNGEEPGAEAARLLIAADRLHGAHENLLHGVFGAFLVAKPDVAVAIDSVEIAVIESGERLSVLSRQGHEGGIRLARDDGFVSEVEAAKDSAHGFALGDGLL
jgi:hypothetical protein